MWKQGGKEISDELLHKKCEFYRAFILMPHPLHKKDKIAHKTGKWTACA